MLSKSKSCLYERFGAMICAFFLTDGRGLGLRSTRLSNSSGQNWLKRSAWTYRLYVLSWIAMRNFANIMYILMSTRLVFQRCAACQSSNVMRCVTYGGRTPSNETQCSSFTEALLRVSLFFTISMEKCCYVYRIVMDTAMFSLVHFYRPKLSLQSFPITARRQCP